MPFYGFDTQIISFIATVLAKEWHPSEPDMGSILSVELFGLLMDDLDNPFSRTDLRQKGWLSWRWVFSGYLPY